MTTPAEPNSPPAQPHFMEVQRFLTASEAESALAMLTAAGIDAELRDEQTAGLMWLYGVALGGVRLEVPSSQEASARELLRHPPSEVEPLAPEDESYYARQRRRRTTRGYWALFLAAPWFAAVAWVLPRLARPAKRQPKMERT